MSRCPCRDRFVGELCAADAISCQPCSQCHELAPPDSVAEATGSLGACQLEFGQGQAASQPRATEALQRAGGTTAAAARRASAASRGRRLQYITHNVRHN